MAGPPGPVAVPADGRVYGDGFTAHVVGVVTTIGTATQRVSPGQRLWFFGLSATTGLAATGGPAVQVTVTVTAGTITLPVGVLGSTSGPAWFEASLPAGSPDVTVDLAAGGFSQSFSLARMARTPDDPPALYRNPDTSQTGFALPGEVDAPVVYTDSSDGSQSSGYSFPLRVVAASIGYFAPDAADHTPVTPGDMWLTVELSSRPATQSPNASAYLEYDTAVTGAQVTVTPPGSQPEPAGIAPGGADVAAGTVPADLTAPPAFGAFQNLYYFEIPATAATAKLTVTPGTLAATPDFSGGHGTATLTAPATVALILPPPGTPPPPAGASATPGTLPDTPALLAPVAPGPGTPTAVGPVTSSSAFPTGIVVAAVVVLAATAAAVIARRRRAPRSARPDTRQPVVPGRTLREQPPAADPPATDQETAPAWSGDPLPPPPAADPVPRPAADPPAQPERSTRAVGEAPAGEPRLEPVALPDIADAALDGPAVRVIGPVELTGWANPPTQPALIELAAYLALQTRPTPTDTIRARLATDPDNELTAESLGTYATRLRRHLGGATLTGSRAGYQLTGITTDIAALAELARRAEGQPPSDAIATLSSALTLVRGQPFADVDFRWVDVEGHRHDTDRQITGVAGRLAALAIDAGRPDRALWGWHQALRAVPLDQTAAAEALTAAAATPTPGALVTEWHATRRRLAAHDSEPAGDLAAHYRRLAGLPPP